MIEKCVNKKAFDTVFRSHSIKVAVFLKSFQSKGSNFDPFRNIGFVKAKRNPVWVAVIKKTLSANSLIYRQMGLNETGAIELIIKDNDVPFITLSEKILVDDKEYYVYNDAVGANVQVFDLQFGYSKIVLFRKKK